MSRLGLLGGSFNPIHNGHIYLANTVKEELNLDKILIIPSNITPNKNCKDFVPNEDRLSMCKLSIEEKTDFEVLDYEINKTQISYTILTIEYLREKYKSDEFYLIIGSDMFLSFDKWYRYKDILKEVILVFMLRSDEDINKINDQINKLSKYGTIRFIEIQPYIVSSTEIREKIKKCENFSCYLPEKVVQYIRLKKLYQ